MDNNSETVLKLRLLNRHLQAIAGDELNEVISDIPKQIKDLKYWIEHQPHLRARQDNDQLLLTFLRGSKHDLQRAKEKIDAFYTIRSGFPELFIDRDVKVDRVRELLRLGVGIPLPNTQSLDGPRVLLIRPGAYDASKFSFIDTLKVGMMIQDVQYLEDDHMSVSGDLGIIDLSNVTAGHFFQVTPVTLKRVLLLKQEGSPLRQKGFHFINIPAGFETLANMGRKLLTEKNRNRIIAHSKLETLYDHIPQELLPTEYGGKAGSITEIMDYWENKLLEYRDYLIDESRFGTDENKRAVPSELAQNIYGLTGVFKKLEID